MLELREVAKSFSGIPAVDGVSFSVRAGEVAGYLGPNGSGKSTTMKMITGIMERTSGEILFDGQPIQRDLIAFKRRMGYVPEEPHLYSHLSGLEYLKMIGQLRELSTKRTGKRLKGCCDSSRSTERLRTLMALPTLEDIFTQLAVEQDPAAVSREIADLIRS